ncbi:MAG: hypothetical protein C0514_08430 [Candidatus Puniceispirillum sp.]|nr:hypothetical protein [Candidatus Puniceispirillum sp.]
MFKGTIKEMLDHFDSFEWNFCVFTESCDVTLNTICVCLDIDDEMAVDTGEHLEVVFEGKSYIDLLSISDIGGVINYLTRQIPNPSDDLKLKAILYYEKTDRFLEVTPEI